MTPHTTTRRTIVAREVVAWAARVSGAGWLAAMAGIHLHLYQSGYSSVPTIGPLFLLNGVLGAVAALVLLVVPGRWLAAASLAGALLELGTLGALVLSLTVGLFGFDESLAAPLVGWTIAVESAGALTMAGYAGYDGWPRLAAWRGRQAARSTVDPLPR